jgi:hypothetical protein
MTFLNALGDFPEMVLGLAFSLACALLLGFVSLKFLVGLMTRQQYNVTIDPNLDNDPSHVNSILWLGAAIGSSNSPTASTIPATTDHNADSDATGGPYLLPAAAPRNRFARNAKPDAAAGGRVVELPQSVAGRIAQGGFGDGWSGRSGDVA